jgi:Ca-activated chloride channel family protein
MARSSRLFLTLLLILFQVPFLAVRLKADTTTVVASGFSRTGTAAVQGSVTIAGSVVDGTLTPLAAVTLTLESGSRVVATTTTDAEGKFTFTGIAPGTYRVRAERTGFPAHTRDLRVPAGATRLQLPLVLLRPSDAVTPVRTEQAVQMPSTALPPTLAPPPPPPVSQSQSAIDSVREVAGGRGGAARQTAAPGMYPPGVSAPIVLPPSSTERYGHIEANRFQSTREQPLSTFSADVDTASYANVRRILSSGQLPPVDAVRVEEFINYFRFDYADSRDTRPIALTTEIGDCPWAPTHKLVLIGARAKKPGPSSVEGRNIVLLMDVSGSMSPPNRLPMLKTAFAQFVDTLRPDDRIAIVTYAGYSGLALPSTPVRERQKIQDAIARLGAGGSTNGASGILLAYRIARETFIPGGVNRVILATDGDFNVGVTKQDDLMHLIERERDSGVFLSVFGVGEGNLNDAMMEQLADRGNGHYAYLDSLQEARRVLVREGDSTLETVAKDVKFQVEFNPAEVAAYKLIGYENRLLAARDFNDDRKDAGEVGAGHTVTVLYEVIPAGSPDARDGRVIGGVDPLKYQPSPDASGLAAPKQPRPQSAVAAATAGEWLTVKVRYKAPDDDRSELMERPVRAGGAVQHLPFAATVAEFGVLLRDQARNERAWDALTRRANALEVPRAQIADKDAFADLVAIAAGLSKRR